MDRVEEFILSGAKVMNYSMSTEREITPRQLCINLSSPSNHLEIPDFYIRSFISLVRSGYDTAIFNLKALRPTVTRRLIKGALSDFMKSSMYRALASVHMVNGDTYYGLPGVIMDSEFNILMIMTFDIEIKEDSVPFIFLNHNCRISPSVFLRQEKPIEKMIVKKVLPYCASHIVTHAADTPYHNPRQLIDDGRKTIRILVEDINPYFIHSVTPPKMTDDTETIVQNILRVQIPNILP